MRILFLGDVVGQPGVEMIKNALPLVRSYEQIDLVIANAENATAGSGCAPRTFKLLRQTGVDLVTMGDHIYKKADLISILNTDETICKPANFPPEAPGRIYAQTKTTAGTPVAVISLLGRTFMKPVDCPFHAVDRVLAELAGKVTCIVVDVHAEATADKYLLAHYLKGRVSAVLGTHTHVPTADEQILPGGTAFLCDVGMTGPYDSVLGRRIDRVLSTTTTFVPSLFDVALGDPRLSGAIIDVNPLTGKAEAIRRLVVNEERLKELQIAASLRKD